MPPRETGRLLLKRRSPRPVAPVRWIVDLARVPNWQQNRWIEPIRAGIHGPSYFQTTNTLPAALTGTPAPPDYGRMMVCHQGRMLAWIGVYVDGARGFRDAERDRLSAVAAQIATPLRIAAMLEAGQGPSALTQRQDRIPSRIALGSTNKQIARELGISPATVKTVVERLLRTSGASSRAALVAWWKN